MYSSGALLTILALFALLSLLAPLAAKHLHPEPHTPVAPNERVRLSFKGATLVARPKVGAVPFLSGNRPAYGSVDQWMVGPIGRPSLIRTAKNGGKATEELCICAGVHNGTFAPISGDAAILAPCPAIPSSLALHPASGGAAGCLWDRTSHGDTTFVLHTSHHSKHRGFTLAPCEGARCAPATRIVETDLRDAAGWGVAPARAA